MHRRKLDIVSSFFVVKSGGGAVSGWVPPFLPLARGTFSLSKAAGRRGALVLCRYGRSRMTMDPRTRTMLGRNTSGFHGPGRHSSGRGGEKKCVCSCHAPCMRRRRTIVDPRIPTMPGRSTSERHRLRQARGTLRRRAGRMKGRPRKDGRYE